MGKHSKRSCSDYPAPAPPPPPSPDLIITGDGNPSPNGDYFEDDLYNGKMSYRRGDNAYFLWYDPDGPEYFLSQTKGSDAVSWFNQTADEMPLGTYSDWNYVTGHPVVAEP